MKSTLKNESTPGGRTFKVTITETYQRTVTIYESEMKEPTVEEAQRVAEDWWQDSQIELGTDDFQGVEFTGREDRRLGCPDAEYFELLRGGYSDWEFPLDTLKRGLAASIGRAEAIRYLKKQQMM